MHRRRRARRRTVATLVAVVWLNAVLVVATPALAKFSAAAAGSGSAQAAQLDVPPAPTATFGGISGLGGILCTINVTWPAVPAGRTYTLYRLNLGAPAAVQTSTTATSYSETFLLALLTGSPSYYLRSTLTGTSWFKESAVSVSHC